MKSPNKIINQCLILFYLLFELACISGLLFPTPAVAEKSVADEIISLNVKDRPLGDVLKDISIVASCHFSIDESWADYPVTVAFENEPLYRGLKLIFRNINNAVIYGTNRSIKIIFYDEGTPSGMDGGHQVTVQPSQQRIHQIATIGEATAPQSEVEVSEARTHMEDVEQLPEGTDEFASEENETDAENTDAHDEGIGETESEETTAALETEEKESDLDAENNQTEEGESTSGGAEDSEKVENSEESNEN